MEFKSLQFPKGFLWGSAASAHQTEGGNNNDWSEWEKIPGKIRDGSNSSIACDHYHRYEEDFDLAKEYGHQVHRFSVEWSRIEPQHNMWNEKELLHYRDVVRALIDRGIRPMVTLHHFTNPIWFRDVGGWLNPDSPEIFGAYCKRVAETLCEYDIIWNTINEPMVLVSMGYLYGEFPPGIKDYGRAVTAAKRLAMAHGKAATEIRNVYESRGMKQPLIAPVISVSYFMPADPTNKDDVELVKLLDWLYNHAWISAVIKGRIPDLEVAEDVWPEYGPMRKSVDFIGINYYSRMLVSSKLDFFAGQMPPKDPKLERCEGLDWEVYPKGYYQVLKSFWERYRMPIFLTENGIGTQNDNLRCRYILMHLQQVHRCIQEGVDIRGYLVWSLTDNFEWAQGFSSHFGLIEIDYQTQKRIPRESAALFKEIIKNNGLTKDMQAKYLKKTDVLQYELSGW